MFSRVHTNVRLILTLSSLSQSVKSGCHRWKDLFGSLQVYSNLPWERKDLVNVAAFHIKGEPFHNLKFYIHNEHCYTLSVIDKKGCLCTTDPRTMSSFICYKSTGVILLTNPCISIHAIIKKQSVIYLAHVTSDQALPPPSCDIFFFLQNVSFYLKVRLRA